MGPIPLIAGIVNCTPDSFSDGGMHGSVEAAVAAGVRMLSQGADWIDVGGESTRPGAAPVPAKVQMERVLPVIRGLRARTDAPISVDTMSPEVGVVAIEAGADIINEVSACRDPGWRDVLRGNCVPVVLAHMSGTPRDMQVDPCYPRGAAVEVVDFFRKRVADLADAGVDPSRTFIDPGIGFGKRVKDNLELIRNIDALTSLGRPVFLGTSRKSFLRRVLEPDMPDPDVSTAIMNALALARGAHVLRVHNVAYASAAVRLYLALEQAIPGPEGDRP